MKNASSQTSRHRSGRRPVRRRPAPDDTPAGPGEDMRIQKYLSRAGICSRREAEVKILAGLVLINGKTASLGQKVRAGKDKVVVEGEGIKLHRALEYFLLYKPTGILSTRKDTHDRRTVVDMIPDSTGYLYPVGRLDADSEGLILLTNDGDMAHLLAHPRHGLTKVYRVLVDELLSEVDQVKFQKGIFLSEGRTRACEMKVVRTTREGTLYEVSLQQGLNRQIRRMFAAFGAKVKKLTRIRMGPLTIKGLAPGQYRPLTPRELAALKERPSKERHADPKG